MQYTLWSRGRLLGETDLGFIYRENGFRCGWFHPSAVGERLMPIATGVGPAIRTDFMLGPDPTFYADVIAAVDAEQALELELRDANGKRIETEDIGITDTEYLKSLADVADANDEDCELTPEQEAEVEEMIAVWEEEHPAWLREEEFEEVELPRYQIQVQLVDHNAIP